MPSYTETAPQSSDVLKQACVRVRFSGVIELELRELWGDHA